MPQSRQGEARRRACCFAQLPAQEGLGNPLRHLCDCLALRAGCALRLLGCCPEEARVVLVTVWHANCRGAPADGDGDDDECRRTRPLVVPGVCLVWVFERDRGHGGRLHVVRVSRHVRARAGWHPLGGSCASVGAALPLSVAYACRPLPRRSSPECCRWARAPLSGKERERSLREAGPARGDGRDGDCTSRSLPHAVGSAPWALAARM
eukprot:2746106-Pleurochrysis_carterae.AAC.3